MAADAEVCNHQLIGFDTFKSAAGKTSTTYRPVLVRYGLESIPWDKIIYCSTIFRVHMWPTDIKANNG